MNSTRKPHELIIQEINQHNESFSDRVVNILIYLLFGTGTGTVTILGTGKGTETGIGADTNAETFSDTSATRPLGKRALQ